MLQGLQYKKRHTGVTECIKGLNQAFMKSFRGHFKNIKIYIIYAMQPKNMTVLFKGHVAQS